VNVWHALVSFWLVACGAPQLASDLAPEGPPEVTLVAVVSQSAGAEVATFCGAGKRNANYCPDQGAVDPVRDAIPLGTVVRIAFDELLDPDIEVIDADGNGSIAAADPVAISCDGQEVTYSGFYDPSGSHLTFPAGPALVITSTSVISSGGSCQVRLTDAVIDKDGQLVPVDQRGPYEFSTAALTLVGTQPADGSEGVDAAATITARFNNVVDEASLATRVAFSTDTSAVPITATVDPNSPSTVVISPVAGPLASGTTFTVTLAAGVADPLGESLAANWSFSFTTAR
jgi:hypothetical protein